MEMEVVDTWLASLSHQPFSLNVNSYLLAAFTGMVSRAVSVKKNSSLPVRFLEHLLGNPYLTCSNDPKNNSNNRSECGNIDWVEVKGCEKPVFL